MKLTDEVEDGPVIPGERSLGVPASSVNTIQWPLRDAVDAGGSINVSGEGVERMMASRDNVQHHIPELKCDFQTANLYSLLFLNTEIKKDRPSPYVVNNKSENKYPSK